MTYGIQLAYTINCRGHIEVSQEHEGVRDGNRKEGAYNCTEVRMGDRGIIWQHKTSQKVT